MANTKADTAQPQTVSLNPSKNITINVSIQGDDVIARNMRTNQQTTLANIPNLPAYARDLWVEDFNFDGVHDIAISTGTNDGGLNQTYSIFTWNSATQALTPLALGSPLSNIEIINNKELRSSYKAGDFWREDSYRFNRNTAYLYSRSDLISINVWHTEFFDKKHQRVKSLLSKNGRNRRPQPHLIGHISIENTAIRSAPLPSSSSNDIYLSKGQPVQLLDFKKNQDGIHWFYIRTNTDTPSVEGWIPLNNIDL